MPVVDDTLFILVLKIRIYKTNTTVQLFHRTCRGYPDKLINTALESHKG